MKCFPSIYLTLTSSKCDNYLQQCNNNKLILWYRPIRHISLYCVILLNCVCENITYKAVSFWSKRTKDIIWATLYNSSLTFQLHRKASRCMICHGSQYKWLFFYLNYYRTQHAKSAPFKFIKSYHHSPFITILQISVLTNECDHTIKLFVFMKLRANSARDKKRWVSGFQRKHLWLANAL